MSADILSFPERTYEPDDAVIFDVLDMAPPGDIGFLIEVAQMALRGVFLNRKEAPTPEICQHTIDGLAMACFALALAIGIPRENLTDLPCGTP
jgi:hypothetical protein